MSLECSISPSGLGLYELNLNGRLHRPHWVVQLFTALAQVQVLIHSGYAVQDRKGEWESKFLLDFSQSLADPLTLNYQAFTELTMSGDRLRVPKLARFELMRREDRFLDLKVEGPDQTGLLACVLSRVSILALFPSAITVETEEGQFRDTIVLRGFSEMGPSDAVYKALQRMLCTFEVGY